MRIFRIWRSLGFVLALAFVTGAATAQGTAGTTKGAAAPAVVENIGIDVLKGTWVRPDGGYMIAIRTIAPNGQLEAMYFNPNPLPFAKAPGGAGGRKAACFF